MTSQENIQKLLAAGVSQEFINAELAKGKSGLAKGSNIDDKDVEGFLNSWKSSGGATKVAQSDMQTRLDNLPDSIKNDPSFKSLTPDMQEIVIYNYEVQKTNDAEKAKALVTALEQATAQADPYWKNIIRIAQDEVMRAVEEANGDFTSANERQKQRIAEINQDLASNKGYLSLEQQSELANFSADLSDKQQTYERNTQYLGADKAAQLAKLESDYNKAVDDTNSNLKFTAEEKASALKKLGADFQVNMESMTQGAADAGLTFSTKRRIAEQRLKDENQGLVESTNRTYNKQTADLQANLAYAQQQKALQDQQVERDTALKQAEQQQGIETARRQTQTSQEQLQREYTKKIAELEIEASRGNTDAAAQIADLRRKLNESITSIGREAEKTLGTENLPNIGAVSPTIPAPTTGIGEPLPTGGGEFNQDGTPKFYDPTRAKSSSGISGYNPLGGITGTIAEEKIKDIETRKNAIYQELIAGSLIT
jgi:hypothetical protein